MAKKVLYCGDTHLKDAAAYLTGLMHHWGWDFDYLASDESPAESQWDADYGLIILSDYPAANFQERDHALALEQVSQGTGLLMLGGWESFHGVGGDWDGTPVGNALPVTIAETDDRRNFDQPALIRPLMEHPILKGLPWKERLPLVGGVNAITPKSEGEVVLEVCLFHVQEMHQDQFTFQLAEHVPLLILGEHGEGRTAAFATDVAPHWVGPLVDWGTSRVTAEAPGSHAIEVGSDYAQFFQQLLQWTMGG